MSGADSTGLLRCNKQHNRGARYTDRDRMVIPLFKASYLCIYILLPYGYYSRRGGYSEGWVCLALEGSGRRWRNRGRADRGLCGGVLVVLQIGTKRHVGHQPTEDLPVKASEITDPGAFSYSITTSSIISTTTSSNITPAKTIALCPFIIESYYKTSLKS